MADKLPLEFHPEAFAELERAKRWYDTQRHGLGESFFQEITAAITRIQEAPNIWPESRQGTRRFLVHRSRLQSSIVNARTVCSSLL